MPLLPIPPNGKAPDAPVVVELKLMTPALILRKNPSNNFSLSFDEAVAEANNTKYGLAAGLISDNEKLFDGFVRRINAGVINFNSTTTGASGAFPFGGIGRSGNLRPAGFYAADYCAWPKASIVKKL